MSDRALYLFGGTVGATAGGFLPSLWGGSDWGPMSIVTSTVCGLLAIWLCYRLVNG